MTATANYLETTINGYTVLVFATFDGDTFHIIKDGEGIYKARVNKGEGLLRATEKVAELSEVKPITKEEKLARGRLVLMSDHIQEVEVIYLATLNNSRYYQARTWAGRHQYQIRFFEVDGERIGTCNCVSKTTCRHLIRAAAVDSQMFDTDIHFETFANYKAHRRAA